MNKKISNNLLVALSIIFLISSMFGNIVRADPPDEHRILKCGVLYYENDINLEEDQIVSDAGVYLSLTDLVKDPYYEDGATNWSIHLPGEELAQSFIASKNMLSKYGVFLGRSSSSSTPLLITVKIREFLDQPWIIAYDYFPYIEPSGEWRYFQNETKDFPITPGNLYYVLIDIYYLYDIAPRYLDWWYGEGNPYPDGNCYSSIDNGDTWSPDNDKDFNFQIYGYDNHPPNQPSTPAGPSSGYMGTSYTYSSAASDPEEHQVSYKFDWGDATSSEWTEFVQSGATGSASHSWSSAGTYYVKAEAKDTYGLVSDWSSSKKVIISDPNQNIPPTVIITYPTWGQTVGGNIIITGTAGDSDGTVTLVQIKIDSGDWWDASGTISWSYDWNTGGVSDGSHTIYARSYDGEDYSNEDVVNVNVNNKPDLTVDELTTDPEYFRAGDDVKLFCHVANIGFGDATNTFIIQWGLDENPIFNLTIYGMAAGSSGDYFYDTEWFQDYDLHVYWIYVDVYNETFESNENNNNLNHVVQAHLPDLEVMSNISTDPEHFLPGQQIQIVAWIENLGGPFHGGEYFWGARFYFDEQSLSFDDVGTTGLDNGRGIYVHSQPFQWPSGQSGHQSHTIRVWADATNAIPEYNEGNNNNSMSRSCPYNPCFLAGTKISMADGSYKNIEDVKAGDLVMAYDLENDKMVPDKVTDVYHHEAKEEMADSYLLINDNLRVTPNHPLLVNGRWVEAGKVKIGDTLMEIDKNERSSNVPVQSIQKLIQSVPTYNLNINMYHSYIANGIVVNDKGGWSPISGGGTIT